MILHASFQQSSQVRQSHCASVGGAGRSCVAPQSVRSGSPVEASRSCSWTAWRCPSTGNHQNIRGGGNTASGDNLTELHRHTAHPRHRTIPGIAALQERITHTLAA